jgi:hypothetical protein
MGSFEFLLRGEVELQPGREPGCTVTDFRGLIRYRDLDTGLTKACGRLRAYRLNVRQAMECIPAVCGKRGRNLISTALGMFDRDCWAYRDVLRSHLGLLMGEEALLIDHVVLRPKWRGLGVGLAAICHALRTLGGGCGPMVCDPTPLLDIHHEVVGVPTKWLFSCETSRAYRDCGRRVRRLLQWAGFP